MDCSHVENFQFDKKCPHFAKMTRVKSSDVTEHTCTFLANSCTNIPVQNLTETPSLQQQQSGRVLLCFSGVCQLNSWCHQTPGPTATLNESLRNGQLCSGQETPLKNYHFVPSTRPLPLFQTCQHCNQRQAWPPATQCCSLPPLPSPPSISQH